VSRCFFLPTGASNIAGRAGECSAYEKLRSRAELEALLANVPDIEKLQRLEDAGTFKAGFTDDAKAAIVRYMLRLCRLRANYATRPYPGPKITTE
jgi:hypothetical protein